MKLEPYYVVGLVDGEGCFIVTKRTGENGEVISRPIFGFTNTNLDILHDIRSALNITGGTIKLKRGNINPCWDLLTSSHNDIEQIIAFFDVYTPIIKRDNYAVFKQAFIDWKYHQRNVNMRFKSRWSILR